MKCIICQEETSEKPTCPANSKRHDSGAGYVTFERDVTSFYEVGELHLAVNWECLNEGNGIASTLTSHFALWPESCRDAFNSTKLERIIKRKMPEKTHGQSSSKRTFSSIFPESVKHSVCFFCEESANVGDLRMACTMDIDSRVRSVVRKLSDFRLIFKLNTTDMVAIGAKYLTRCLKPRCTIHYQKSATFCVREVLGTRFQIIKMAA